MLASYYAISDKPVETVEPHTASCHLEVTQLGVQHKAIFILSLQLYPSATAAQILDNTETPPVVELPTFLLSVHVCDQL